MRGSCSEYPDVLYQDPFKGGFVGHPWESPQEPGEPSSQVLSPHSPPQEVENLASLLRSFFLFDVLAAPPHSRFLGREASAQELSFLDRQGSAVAEVDWTKFAPRDQADEEALETVREVDETVDLSTERDWLDENAAKYENQWIALDGNRLIAASADFAEVSNVADEQGVDCPFIIFVESEDRLPEAGLG